MYLLFFLYFSIFFSFRGVKRIVYSFVLIVSGDGYSRPASRVLRAKHFIFLAFVSSKFKPRIRRGSVGITQTFSLRKEKSKASPQARERESSVVLHNASQVTEGRKGKPLGSFAFSHTAH